MLYCTTEDALVLFETQRQQDLSILVGDSCGKFQNSENYPCFFINTVLVYTLISDIKYCESATARPVENFAIIF